MTRALAAASPTGLRFGAKISENGVSAPRRVTRPRLLGSLRPTDRTNDPPCSTATPPLPRPLITEPAESPPYRPSPSAATFALAPLHPALDLPAMAQNSPPLPTDLPRRSSFPPLSRPPTDAEPGSEPEPSSTGTPESADLEPDKPGASRAARPARAPSSELARLNRPRDLSAAPLVPRRTPPTRDGRRRAPAAGRVALL